MSRLEANLRLPLCKTSNPGCFRKIVPIIRVLHVVLGNVSAKYLLTPYWILWPWWHSSISTVCLFTKLLAKWHSCAGMSQAKYYQPIITFIHTELLSAGRVFCWRVEAWMCLIPSRTNKSQCDRVFVFASNSDFKIRCRSKKLMASGFPTQSVWTTRQVNMCLICGQR